MKSVKLTPRVLDDPVVLSVLSAISDRQHAVIESGSALSVEHTSTVQLESPFVGLDGHTDRLLRDRLRCESGVSNIHSTDYITLR